VIDLKQSKVDLAPGTSRLVARKRGHCSLRKLWRPYLRVKSSSMKAKIM